MLGLSLKICGSYLSGVVIFQCNSGVKEKESRRKMYGDQSVISQREEQGFLSS